MDTREAIRSEFMCAYARERLDHITVKSLCAAVPVARTRRHWDLIAEMGASAIVGAYVWWMHHPDATGLAEAKRLVTRAVEGVVSSIQQ